MVTVVLPAYDEADAIGPLLERTAAVLDAATVPYRILVVDDGSTDGTAEVVRGFAARMPVELEAHERNRGLGRALTTGLGRATPESEVVVTMDADGTHDPGLIPAMVDRLGDAVDVVIASRFVEGGEERGVPARRRVMSHGVRILMRSLFPVPGVRDYSCGFRAYRGAFLRRARRVHGEEELVRESGFACMVELLLRLAELGARFEEVPLVLRYDVKRGASKIRVARTIGRYLVVAWKNLGLAVRLNAKRFG